MSQLQGARDLTFNQSTLIAIAGDNTVNNIHGPDAISELARGIASSALHDSAERSSDSSPRCMEGTRVQLQQDIMDWLDGDYDSDRLWMHGAAGSGKSAVAQSIAETCAKKRSLAAAFFFNFRHTETDNHARFIPTIAYQLAQSIPSTRAFIGEVVSKDVLILKKGFKVQLEALLLKPLAQARELNPDEQWPHVIIIDGLDECKEKVEQAAILTALHERTKSPTFPFRIIIVSRPEIQMRKYFSGIGNSRTFTIDLNGEEYNVEPDLDIFLRVSFDSIRRENHIEGEWPGENAIVELKSRATGQFVYADTVVKYVGDDTRQPKEHLKEVMDLRANPGEKHPLSPLYALYDNILRRCADPKGSALAIRSVNERVTVRELAAEFNALFYFTPDSWARIFDNLHSLLFIPEYTDAKSKYKIRHKSLIDFLKSKESTKDMYFSEKTVNTGMAVKFLQLFERYSSESSRQNASNVVKYMLPLQNIFFSWALSKSDLKDSRLVQLLGSIDVASCVLPDGDNKFHQNDLNRLWSAVHHKDLGCSPLRCGSICRKWRTGVVETVLRLRPTVIHLMGGLERVERVHRRNMVKTLGGRVFGSSAETPFEYDSSG